MDVYPKRAQGLLKAKHLLWPLSSLFFIFNKTVFFANAKLLKLSVLVWQGGGAKVSVGEVSDLLAGEERAQLPRLLLPPEGGFRRRAQDSAPAQSRDLQLSQQGEYTAVTFPLNTVERQ